MTALLISALFAANSFPPCGSSNVNQVWQAQDTTFWWCGGKSTGWVPVTASPDGGVLDHLYIPGSLGVDGGAIFNSTVAINKTLSAQDAGFDFVEVAGSLSVDGTQLIARTASFSQFSVGGAGNAWLDAQSSGVNIFGVPALLQHSLTQMSIECGMDAGTSGVLTVAFGTAFSSAPICTCSHVDTTNTNACTIDHTVVPTTAIARFNAASGGTDKLSWCCVGPK